MNCKEYYARQVGGALPDFAGTQHKRDHRLGERCCGIVKGGVEDRRAHRRLRLFRTEHKKAAKRRITYAVKSLMRGLLTHGVRPLKRIKRAPARKGVTSERQRKRQTTKKLRADIFDNDGFHT